MRFQEIFGNARSSSNASFLINLRDDEEPASVGLNVSFHGAQLNFSMNMDDATDSSSDDDAAFFVQAVVQLQRDIFMATNASSCFICFSKKSLAMK